jgi:phosphate transport system permease protein
MRKWFEQGITLFSWGSVLLLLSALSFVLGYLVFRGGGSVGSGLVFGNIPPLDALLLRRQVFNGLFPAIVGTFALVLIAVGLAVPVGLAAGVYMAEYCRGRMRRLLTVLFDILAGLPSIVVGLAGFSLTIVLHRLMPGRLGPCLLVSALAMSFLILPYLIRSTQLALESVAPTLRQCAPALGASRLQNIRHVLLPSRLPDILGGIILATGRAAEDTAVIMLTGVVASAGLPRSLFEQFEALPFYIYYISSQYSDPGELEMGFGAAVLLLAVCAVLFVGAFLIEQTISWRLKRY